MTKTTKTTPAAKKAAAAPKTTERASPGLKRLRKSANAEAIREAVLTDQANGRAEAAARIAAAPVPEAAEIDLPAGFAIGKASAAPETPAEAPRAAPAPQAGPPRRPRPPAREGGGKRAEMLASAQSGVLPPPGPISRLRPTRDSAPSSPKWSRSSRRAMSRASPPTNTRAFSARRPRQSCAAAIWR
jgi:hypothetical protein